MKTHRSNLSSIYHGVETFHRPERKCSQYFSDNGRNFVGAYRELKEMRELFLKSDFTDKIEEYAAKSNFKWHFIPPQSPHFGGIWEAGVKSMKHHLKRAMLNACLTYEQFSTLLAQIEAILNSRPICALIDDPNSSYLSPGHFLIGTSLTEFPEPSLSEVPKNRLDQWKRIQQIKQHLWTKWSRDYLHTLQQRPKWRQQQPNIQPGTVVLLVERDISPLQWKIGVVQEIHPGCDKLVRVASVRIGDKTVKKSIVNIVPLPTQY